MMTKAKTWFARALALVGGGVLGAAAILLAFQEEGLTCSDVDQIVAEMEAQDSPDLIPFQQAVVPLVDCETEIKPRCSRLPDGTFCRGGLRYGNGHGGVIVPAHPNDGPPVPDTCVVTDGVITPCVTDGRYDVSTYDPAKVDPVDVVMKIMESHPELTEKATEEVVSWK